MRIGKANLRPLGGSRFKVQGSRFKVKIDLKMKKRNSKIQAPNSNRRFGDVMIREFEDVTLSPAAVAKGIVEVLVIWN